ncbi:hypothetical protein Taro_019728 [Colocasia esculenta]|uniref:Uncharacterized protein n=1 Tax=Colocasia esculenta TaxID=4460 RepID=A0A843V057_COLES|nr:hypothetical protein [Colocasia esculenta]
MRGECPELKKKLKKKKFTFKKAKAMLATLSDEDEDENSQATSGDDEVQYLMARSDDSNEDRKPASKGKLTRQQKDPLKRSVGALLDVADLLLICLNHPLVIFEVYPLKRSVGALLDVADLLLICLNHPLVIFEVCIVGRQRITPSPLRFLPPYIFFLSPVTIHFKIQPQMAPPARKMASRRRPRSPEDGQGSRAPTEPERSTGKTVCQSSSSLRTFTYSKLQPLFDVQSWSPFCYNHKRVKGTSYRISLNLFSVALQIPNTGVDIISHHHTPEEYHTLITLQSYDPTDHKQLNANSFPLLHRLIHHIFTTIIVPKDGSHELVTSIHKSLLHKFLNCEPINLPLLMVSILRICLRSSKRSMPYACQLTSLFLFLDIHIPKEEMTALKSRSSYDLTAAQRMDYKMVDGIMTRDLKGKGQATVEGDGEDEEGANEDEAEDQEAEDSQSKPIDGPGDGDSIAAGDTVTEPSIRDLIAQLQIQMSTGFAKLNDRLDTVDTSLEALADSQVQLQLRLTRLSTHVQENSQAPAPPGPDDA